MKQFLHLNKLKTGDKVAILSPSFAAPGKWPHVYELGLKRLKMEFGLVPVEYPTTKKIGASGSERAADLIAAFQDSEIKAVISTLGGMDQVTYVKKLPREPFAGNPKPFFGFSDNTHIINHLWECGVPAYYGGGLFNQFAMQIEMDPMTAKYLNHAFFDEDYFELKPSSYFNDVGLDWGDPENLSKERLKEKNEGWYWDGEHDTDGITWGGCLESIDEMLRHGVRIPSLEEFEEIVLLIETSEEIPTSNYVFRVLRALGERGILANIKGLLVGRPKAWEFHKQNTEEAKKHYKKEQRQVILEVLRKYNTRIPVIQNMDFGHTDPQVPMPIGSKVEILSEAKEIRIQF